MAITRPIEAEGGGAPGAPPGAGRAASPGTAAGGERREAPRRRIARPRRLPGGRAVVGGLLVALAGVGTLVAWQQAAGTPDHRYAVAARTLQPGEVVAADDVRLVPVDLPDGLAGAAFGSAAEVDGRVALGPIGEGELIQSGVLSEPGAGVPRAEVSFALARDRANDGRLGSGDLVDVLVTYDDRGTSVVAERVQVVAVTDGGASFASGAELTVTLAVAGGTSRTELVQAVRSGEVTLVRSTHLGSASGSAAPPGGPASPASTGSPPPADGSSPDGLGDASSSDDPGGTAPPGGSGGAAPPGGEVGAAPPGGSGDAASSGGSGDAASPGLADAASAGGPGEAAFPSGTTDAGGPPTSAVSAAPGEATGSTEPADGGGGGAG